MQTLAQQIAATRRTKKFKALVAIGLSEHDALAKLGVQQGPAADERLADLIAGGFSEAEAREILATHDGAPASPAPAPVVEPPKPATSQDLAEALVEASPFKFSKGRVYVGGDAIEAQVRVRKTGKPEIIAASGVGRTTAMVLFRTETGEVAIQNLTGGDA